MQDTGVEGMDRDRDEGLVELAPELVHKVALGGWLGVRDVAALSQTCRRMADILVWDEYGRDLHHALEGVMENVWERRWKAARYAVNRRWYGGDGGGLWKEVAEVVMGLDKISVEEEEELAGWENVLLAALSLPGAASECFEAWKSRKAGVHTSSLVLIAATLGSERVIDWVVERGGDLEARRSGATPLHVACRSGHFGVARRLVEGGADVMARTYGHASLLQSACQCDDVDLVRYVAGLGVFDVDGEDQYGYNPLRIACWKGKMNVVKLLVEEMGADVDVEGRSSKGPLYWACVNGNVEIVRMLVDLGSGSGAGKDGHVWLTGFVEAASQGHSDVVRELIERGVAVDGVDKYGDTALGMASQNGCVGVVKVLVGQGGADVDVVDRNGRTPLYWASRNGREKVVSVLLEAGADVEIADHDGVTAMGIALAEGFFGVVALLEEWAGAGVEGEGGSK